MKNLLETEKPINPLAIIIFVIIICALAAGCSDAPPSEGWYYVESDDTELAACRKGDK